jgi:hypothetical protein
MGEAFDSTKTGNFQTKVKDELVFNLNWDKVKTFEDFILLAKSGVIKSDTRTESDLKGKDKEIKKFFKTDGSKVLIVDNEPKNG